MAEQVTLWRDNSGATHATREQAEAADLYWCRYRAIDKILDDGGDRNVRMPSVAHLTEIILRHREAILEALK